MTREAAVGEEGARVLRLVPRPPERHPRRVDTRPLLVGSMQGARTGPNKQQMRQAVHVLDYAAGVLRRLRDGEDDDDVRASLGDELAQLQEARTTLLVLTAASRLRMPRGPAGEEWS